MIPVAPLFPDGPWEKSSSHFPKKSTLVRVQQNLKPSWLALAVNRKKKQDRLAAPSCVAEHCLGTGTGQALCTCIAGKRPEAVPRSSSAAVPFPSVGLQLISMAKRTGTVLSCVDWHAPHHSSGCLTFILISGEGLW